MVVVVVGVVLGVVLVGVLARCGGMGRCAMALRRGIATAQLPRSAGIACTMSCGQAGRVQMPGVCSLLCGGTSDIATIIWLATGVLVVTLVAVVVGAVVGGWCGDIGGSVVLLRGACQRCPCEQ